MVDSLLSALDISSEDKVLLVKENKLADANFIITSLMSHTFSNGNNVCLIAIHNTLGHYHNVCKRLGFDLLNHVKEKRAVVIEPFKDTIMEMVNESGQETIVKKLLTNIENAVNTLCANGKETTLLVDDLSHLFDLGSDIRIVNQFAKHCIQYSRENKNISVVIGYHTASAVDQIITNVLSYMADKIVDVSALKTGSSRAVSGIITIESTIRNTMNQYHYKLMDKEIRIFAPGTAFI